MDEGTQVEKPSKTPAKIDIQGDRASRVAKTVVGISPLLCPKAPTLDQLDHRVEFMVRGISQPKLPIINNNNNKDNIFYDFLYIFLTNKKKNKHTFQ